jgi:arylsulfatase A-like enzyme
MRILYVDVDTLRADHTGPYGYPRRLTPNLDALAKQAVVFERCYASDGPCAPSRGALTSGQFGITTGAIGNFGPACDLHLFERTRHAPFLGGHLYRHGVYTASVSCFPERHYAYWFVGNFREWTKPTLSSGDDEDAADVTAVALDWLRRRGREESFFLHVHFWDPHIPYLEPEPWFERAAASGPPPAWPDEATIAEHAETAYGPHSALDLYEGDGTWSVPPPLSPNPRTMPDAIRSREDFERFVTGYDGAVAYVDEHLGRLLNALEDLGVLEETAVVVTADHGECLGEQGIYGDHPLANEPSHRVPLVVRWPGLTTRLPVERRRVAGLAYQLDLAPTLCDLLGIPVPEGWEGLSLAPALRGEEFAGRPELVLSHGAYSYQRALRTPDRLYVRTLHPGLFRAQRQQLFDVVADPVLSTDLATERPDEVEELDGRLMEWIRSHATMQGDIPDPMEARRYEGPMHAFSAPRYLERLRATGRARLAEDLQARLEAPWVTSGRW